MGTNRDVDVMTEDPLLRIRRNNLESMRRDLYKLKRQYEELFRKWLAKKGEYLTATHVRWAEFRAKAIEYKELWAKVNSVAREVEQ